MTYDLLATYFLWMLWNYQLLNLDFYRSFSSLKSIVEWGLIAASLIEDLRVSIPPTLKASKHLRRFHCCNGIYLLNPFPQILICSRFYFIQARLFSHSPAKNFYFLLPPCIYLFSLAPLEGCSLPSLISWYTFKCFTFLSLVCRAFNQLILLLWI